MFFYFVYFKKLIFRLVFYTLKIEFDKHSSVNKTYFMEMNLFMNDWHTVVNFGTFKGTRLIDLPGRYLEWLFYINNAKFGDLYEIVVRIKNRCDVKLFFLTISVSISASYVPDLIQEIDILPIIKKPKKINRFLFNSFMEYLVKYSIDIKFFTEVDIYLANYGLVTLPDNLRSRWKDILIPDIFMPDKNKRAIYIKKIYDKKIYKPYDLCNLSFASSLCLGTFKEEQANVLLKYVTANNKIFLEYCNKIKDCQLLPKLIENEQFTCDKISIGCIIGVIDAISNDTIITIMYRTTDSIEYYRKCLFTYACLHRLRYGKIIKKCKIYNFLTGKIFTMETDYVHDEMMFEYVKNLREDFTFHNKLFE